VTPFTITQRWACAPDEAFDRLTNSATILREAGVATTIKTVPGGPFEWYFLDDGPEGARGSEGCTILSVEPGHRLTFTWNAPPTLPRTRARFTRVEVTLTADGAATVVTLTHSGWPSADEDDHEEWPRTRDYFVAAWPRFLALCGPKAAP
jgi:uncharacterized protein YndB with AHSA1/START domain